MKNTFTLVFSFIAQGNKKNKLSCLIIIFCYLIFLLNYVLSEFIFIFFFRI